MPLGNGRSEHKVGGGKDTANTSRPTYIHWNITTDKLKGTVDRHSMPQRSDSLMCRKTPLTGYTRMRRSYIGTYHWISQPCMTFNDPHHPTHTTCYSPHATWKCSAFRTRFSARLPNFQGTLRFQICIIVFKFPNIYDYITTLCRKQGQVIQNYENLLI